MGLTLGLSSLESLMPQSEPSQQDGGKESATEAGSWEDGRREQREQKQTMLSRSPAMDSIGMSQKPKGKVMTLR